ncbi:MAG TPA: hypothetical protein PLU22_26940 [Polyangiaceae bacterium]|nr:hypothetical protein [Polyangiaceae bacterium]
MAFSQRLAPLGASVAIGGLVFLGRGAEAHAQGIIENPGDHPDYAVELDPHLVLQYGYTPVWYDEGIGLGFRASIPFLDGPIPTINNSMAITFGGDWAYFGDDDCYDYYYWYYRADPPNIYWGDHGCHGHALTFPVALQWNFWLTDIISVFGEPGLALGYRRWEGLCRYGDTWADCDDDDFEFLPFVMWGGARFLFGERVGMTVRLGYPSVNIGATFLL